MGLGSGLGLGVGTSHTRFNVLYDGCQGETRCVRDIPGIYGESRRRKADRSIAGAWMRTKIYGGSLLLPPDSK
jgi:hypothetical protein